MRMPPREKTILPYPWENHTYYRVVVSWERCNPVHEAILYSGFVNYGLPGNYSGIWVGAGRRIYPFKDLHFIKVIDKLFTETK